LSTTCRGISICAIFRPGICKNIFLPSSIAILFLLVIQNSSSSYERIKNAKVHRVMNKYKKKQVTVLLSNQKAPKRYKLIL
jgi:hypothetical protein